MQKLAKSHEYFARLEVERTHAAQVFEEKESFEMAFVARWSIVETVVKCVVADAGLQTLGKQLQEWMRFLDGSEKTRPRPIKRFPSAPEDSRLPVSSEIEKHFPSATDLLDLLDPSKKFRRKRNAIAHSADAFASRRTYEEYRAKVVAAIAELHAVLN